MKRNLWIVVLLGGVIASSLDAGLPTGGDYTITRTTIDAGGGSSAGGSFSLTGTIGQPDANPQASSGGDYKLAGGFWARIADFVFVELIFEDSFED